MQPTWKRVSPVLQTLWGGGQITLNSNSEVNGTVANTITATSLLDNGGKCDGAGCILSNTLAPSYAFALDAGNGSDGLADVNTTYSTDKQFSGINLNDGDTLTLANDITVRFQNPLNMNNNTKLIIDGHVTIHIPTFNQNMGSEVEIKSGGSLTLIANSVNLDSMVVISPSDFTCLASTSINVNTNVQLKGLLYSSGTLTLDNDVILTGAATANQLTLNENSAIVYDLGVLASESVCSVTLDNYTELSFATTSDGVHETGTIYEPGSTYRVAEIAPGIDGIITLNERVSDSMSDQMHRNIGAVITGGQESMMFDMTLRLVDTGTTTTISTPVDLVLSSLDLDGDPGEPYSDGVVFYNPDATFVNAGSKVQPTYYSDHVMYTTRIDARGFNDDPGTPGPFTPDPAYGAGAVYKDVTSIHYRGVVVNNTYSARSILIYGTRTMLDEFTSLQCNPTEGDVIRGTVYHWERVRATGTVIILPFVRPTIASVCKTPQPTAISSTRSTMHREA